MPAFQLVHHFAVQIANETNALANVSPALI
jgi:hypothetical protein